MSKRALILLLLSAAVLSAQTITGPGATIPTIADPTRLTEAYRVIVGHWISAAETLVGGLFAALALIDLTVYGIFLALDRHTLETAAFASARKLFAIAWFFTMLLNGNQWMPLIINSFVDLGKGASGTQSLAPSVLLQSGVNIAGSLIWSAAKAGFMDGSIITGGALIVGALMVFLAFLVMCGQFVVALVDTYVAIGIASIALALGGSKWTLPYVERYIAFCVASGVKLMAMYLLVGGAWFLTQGWKDEAAQVGLGTGSVMTGWIIAGAAFLFVFVVWHCSRLVSSFLGGAPSLTGSDVVAFLAPFASAAVATAALAAAPATGGASLAVAGSAGASAAGGLSSGLNGGSSAGGSPPHVSPPSSSGGGRSGGGAALGAAQIAANFMQRAPASGHHGGTPKTGGF